MRSLTPHRYSFVCLIINPNPRDYQAVFNKKTFKPCSKQAFLHRDETLSGRAIAENINTGN